MDKTNTTLLGVALDLGAENLGVDIGPNAFRDQQIVEKLSNVGFSMTDAGNVIAQHRDQLAVGDAKLKYLEEIVKVCEETAKKTHDLIKSGEKAIVLGGDHSICLGAISGASVALEGELGLIYLDAHGDMNTVETTLTGNIHGMPLAALMGFGDKRLTAILSDSVKIRTENMLNIGGNDFDPGELQLIEKENLNCFTTFDVLTQGLGALFERIDALSKRVKNTWVSIDLDSIDEMYAPGVGMPNRAGLTYREVTTIVHYIGSRCQVVGVDVDEYNPLHDVNGKTAELGIELIAKALGKNYNWYTNYMKYNKL